MTILSAEVEIDLHSVLEAWHICTAWAILLREYTALSTIGFRFASGSPGTTDQVLNLHVDVDKSSTIAQLMMSCINAMGVTTKNAPKPLPDAPSTAVFFHGAKTPDTSLTPQESQMAINVWLKEKDRKAVIAVVATATKRARLRRTAEHMKHVLQQVLQPERLLCPVSQVVTITESDLNAITKWNGTVPQAMESCVHSLFAEMVQANPSALAVDAWDASFSYGELDDLSTSLAVRLIGEGATPRTIVPVCFEKSAWTSVAVLAVIKAGAAFVLLDAQFPDSRTRAMVSQLRKENRDLTILASATQAPRLSSENIHVLVVDSKLRTTAQPRRLSIQVTNNADPAGLLYVVFTSGTTGTAKGVKITHKNLATSITHYAVANAISETSRILDMSPYAFDVAIQNMMVSLLNGACLCIPSSWELQNDLAGAMKRFRVSFAELTPSVANTVEARDVPALNVLNLGGEPVSPSVLDKWTSAGVQLINSYGPAECTITCTLEPGLKNAGCSTSIGRGLGAVTWVVDPEDYHRLLPIGATGELLIEGPVVGDGYLDDQSTTAQAFIPELPWDIPQLKRGERGPVYRTGDLVRYNDEGSLEYMGRVDSQVKVRGQRVELEEVEYHLHRFSPSTIRAAPEVVRFRNGAELLVAFVVISGDISTFSQSVTQLFSKLQQSLSSGMVPAAFIPVQEIPLSATGKRDRRQLKQLASNMEVQDCILPGRKEGEIAECNGSSVTQAEAKLSQLWVSILNLGNGRQVGSNDNFFHLGGESLAAIHLIGAARKVGLQLTVATVFQYPELWQMAENSTAFEESTRGLTLPFELLPSHIPRDRLLSEIANDYPIDVSDIEDAYPCTPLQEGMMASLESGAASYMGREILKIPTGIDVTRFQTAWDRVIAAHGILRTRIVDTRGAGLLQVVLRPQNIMWESSGSLAEYVQQTDQQKMGIGNILGRWAIVPCDSVCYFVLTLHHAIFDGWTLPRIGMEVFRAYKGIPPLNITPYNAFLGHLLTQPRESTQQFWSAQLADSRDTSFWPPLPSYSPNGPQPNASLRRSFPIPMQRPTGVSLPLLIRSAWAILMWNLTGNPDVTFGAIVSGRSVPLPGIEDLLAPTISTVPVRLAIDENINVGQFIDVVQSQAVEMIPHENIGLQNIQAVNSETKHTCQFQTLLVIQPPAVQSVQDPGSMPISTFETELQTALHNMDAMQRLSDFNSYAIMLDIMQKNGSLVIDASYDTDRITEQEVERALSQFEHVLERICAPCSRTQRLESLDLVSPNDISQIWEWNMPLPGPYSECIDRQIGSVIRRQPHAQAICAWDGSLTYSELDSRADQLAKRLQARNLQPGSIVPICMEKSLWATVAMLAILRVGATFVLMDIRHQTIQRLKTIMSQTSASLVVTLESNKEIAREISTGILLADDNVTANSKPSTSPSDAEPGNKPSDVAFLVFTSGSTGVPKGIKLTHENFLTSVMSYARVMNLDGSTRVFDFASYSFDVAVHNSLATLVQGACVCVPHEDGRENDIEGCMEALNVNWAHLTPSVARSLDPARLPFLKTLNLSGEKATPDIVSTWRGKAQLNVAYGPAECQYTAVNSCLTSPQESSNVGRGRGCSIWILQPKTNKLAPIGAVGEIVVEGSVVSPGYLDPKTKSTAAWIRDPPWLSQKAEHRPGHIYRTGDLGRFNPDGSITYIGRADTQVKINGQRIELGDVEAHLQACLQTPTDICVDIVQLVEGESKLFAFHVLPRSGKESNAIFKAERITEDNITLRLIDPPREAVNDLRRRLPPYMIPSVFVSVSRIPLTTTGKRDRKRLQQMASLFSREEVLGLRNRPEETSSGLSKTHLALRSLWSQVLTVDPNMLSTDSNFFMVGGDSIRAMRLVHAARREGFAITVKEVFRRPTLSQMEALVIKSTENEKSSCLFPTEKKSGIINLSSRVDDQPSFLRSIAAECGVDPRAITKVYHTTPHQEGLMSMTMESPGAYIYHAKFKVGNDADLEKLIRAWDIVIATNDVFRTRLVHESSTNVLAQVVINEGIHWSKWSRFSDYLKTFAQRPMGLGTPLNYLGIVGSGNESMIVWSVHHALYDMWTLDLVLAQVRQAYHGDHLLSPQYHLYVDYVQTQQKASRSFWENKLADAQNAAIYPAVPKRTSRARPDNEIKRVWQAPASKGSTIASLCRTALALLLSRITNSETVTFGESYLGRSIPVQGIDTLCGPTTCTVPVVLHIDPKQLLQQFVADVQEQTLDMELHGPYGLQNIATLNPGAAAAVEFQTLLVIQPDGADGADGSPREASSDTIWPIEDGEDDRLASFNSYPLLLYVTRNSETISVRASYDRSIISDDSVQFFMDQFHSLFSAVTRFSPNALVEEMNLAQPLDLSQIWAWNRSLPAVVESFVHEMISEQARITPQATAILGHDGELTYEQLDHFSTLLSRALKDRGIGPGSFIPLCFEKSIWTPIAMIAVAKAGGTFTPMDVSHPIERLRQIVEQVGPEIILSSEKQGDIANQLAPSVMFVSRVVFSKMESVERLKNQPTGDNPESPNRLSPSHFMYICFTSGTSGGRPKAVTVTHQNLASAVTYQARPLGFNETSRVFDFSAYSFDATIWHTFHTLVTGGCLCTPSEQDRLENIEEAITRFRSNFGFLTPSVARRVVPEKVPTMRTLFLGGEAVSPTDVSMWAGAVRLGNAYGPTEVTPLSIFNQNLGATNKATNIGHGLGAATWISNPDNPNELVAIGAVGEILLEGPIVTAGYLANPAATKAAFIENPTFLTKGNGSSYGRQGRLYRTGDLARYCVDGSIEYLGRMGTQAKLRGQRIDFGEIEYHLQSTILEASHTVADIVRTPSGGQVLAAFLTLKDGSSPPQSWSIARQQLASFLPRHMVPETFMVIDQIPQSSAGKIDRLKLREIGASQYKKDASADSYNHQYGPLTEMETRLSALWASVLEVEVEGLFQDSNFHEVGGESIAAMKLSALARRQGFRIRIADILRAPELSAMALHMLHSDTGLDSPTSFTLFDSAILPDAKENAASRCGVAAASVEDVYPCTPLQAGLFALTLKSISAYVRRAIFKIPKGVRLQSLIQAWQAVIRSNPILRTRIVRLDKLGLMQVVVNENPSWATYLSVEAFLDDNEKQAMGLGLPLSRWAVVSEGEQHSIVWVMHHALYDGWSMQILDEQLQQAYAQGTIQPSVSMNQYVRFLQSQDFKAATVFWKSFLAGSESAFRFPTVPSDVHKPASRDVVKRMFQMVPKSIRNLQGTLSAAWAITIRQMTDTEDISFGATLAGRDVPLGGIERIVGPTIVTVPVRVRVRMEDHISEVLDNVRDDYAQISSFQCLGLQNIAAIDADTNAAVKFNTLIALDDTDDSEDHHETAEEKIRTSSAEIETGGGSTPFHLYPLVISVSRQAKYLAIEGLYDPDVLEEREVQRLLGRLEQVLKLTVDNDHGLKTVGSISSVGPDDLDDIWRWNSQVPSASERCVHEIILESARERPHASAIDAWDCQLTYHDLESLSRRLSWHLVDLGIGPGSIVPLLTGKSGWVGVAATAIMRAGGALLLLDMSQPQKRLQTILERVNSDLIVTTPTSFHVAVELAKTAVQVNWGEILTMPDSPPLSVPAPVTGPEDTALVQFTSGSTGTPKGIVLSHRNISSGILHQTQLERYTPETRAFDFAAYSFDVSWDTMFKALAAGSCLCVPTEHERKNDLVGAINRSRATLLHVTPSVARLLEPRNLPHVKNLHMAGEAVSLQEFSHWQQSKCIEISYGPSECTSTSTLTISGTPEGIGRGCGTVTWIVDPSNPSRLAPIGAPGELLLEGPLIGKGYFQDASQTAAAFVEGCSWLKEGHAGYPGRSGRLYRTGDLVRYDSTGAIHFISRLNTQVKLNGQRIELEEVEHSARRCSADSVLNLVADVLTLKDAAQPSLILVVACNGTDTTIHCELSHPPAETSSVLEGVDKQLRLALPSYMVPSAYLFVDKLPLTISGKVDRRKIRAVAGAASPSSIFRFTSGPKRSHREPGTNAETKLRNAWATVLNMKEGEIGADDDFFHHNGDSIRAIQLVALLSDSGERLSVTEIFEHPLLSDQAQTMAGHSQHGQNVKDIGGVDVDLFADSIDEQDLWADAATKCKLGEADAIEEILPCTPLQESMIVTTVQQPSKFVNISVNLLKPNVDINAFCQAWTEVAARNPILRTRIVSTRHASLVQCVVKHFPLWEQYDSVESCVQQFQARSMGLGTPLLRWSIVPKPSKSKTGGKAFVMAIHHVLYDGWSLDLLTQQVAQAYHEHGSLKQYFSLKPLLQYCHVADLGDGTRRFWRDELEGAEMSTIFPSPPSRHYRPGKLDFGQYKLAVGKDSRLPGVSTTTVLYASWSILIARLTGSQSVAFGALLTGRNIPMDGITQVVGPVITTVPICIGVDPGQNPQVFLAEMQKKFVAMMPHEHYGLHRIRRIHQGAETACKFQTMFVIQPRDSSSESDLSKHRSYDSLVQRDDSERVEDNIAALNENALLIEVTPRGHDIMLRVSFDPNVIDRPQIDRLMVQWEHIVQRLLVTGNVAATSPRTVEDLGRLSNSDLKQIWRWNGSPVNPTLSCVPEVLSLSTVAYSDAPAIHAWDGQLNYRELNHAASQLCRLLSQKGLERGAFVPLLFEKSLWMSVSMLAVMKLGAVFVPLDVTHPEGRLQAILRSLQARTVLCSATASDSASNLALNRIIVDSSIMKNHGLANRQDGRDGCECLDPKPEDIAYIVFTSGSTGEPKAIQITHANLSTALHHQPSVLGFGPKTRSLDSSSYAFDACVFNLFYTLSQGGCLCVPREEDRVGNIGRVIRDYRVTLAQLTPSVARVLNPSFVGAQLKTVIFTGEPLTPLDIRKWKEHVQIVNVYGPTECTIMCSGTTALRRPEDACNIGRGLGATLWLTEVGNPDRLAMIGAVGEVLIEGPLIGAGYLNDPDRNAGSHITNPQWLVAGVPRENPGRNGTLFRTGDLARYASDGSLIYVGRDQSEIKLRGQRVDVAGVEDVIRQSLPPTSEVATIIVAPSWSDLNDHQQILLCFVCLPERRDHSSALADIISIQPELDFHLPSYLKPSAYRTLNHMPKTSSGKIDRRALKTIASTSTREQLIWPMGENAENSNTDDRAPLTPMEDRLSALWAIVLNIDRETVRVNQNFFTRGGDSINVMQLVTLAQENKIDIKATDVFNERTLCALAQVAVSRCNSGFGHTPEIREYTPYSLMDGPNDAHPDDIRSLAADQLHVLPDKICDIYPANAFQTRCLTHPTRPLDLEHLYFDLSPGINWERLVQAWKLTMSSFESMRGRFIKHSGKYYHVILREPPLLVEELNTSDTLTVFCDVYCDTYSNETCHLTPVSDILSKITLVTTADGSRRVILRMSHAQYDGFCIGNVICTLQAAYSSDSLGSNPPFTRVLQWRKAIRPSSLDYWRTKLRGCSAVTPSPRLKPGMKKATFRSRTMPSFHDVQDNKHTRPTVVVNVAWALTLQELMSTTHVIFANVTTGRNEGMPNAHMVVGPCVNLVPVRFQVEQQQQHARSRQQHLLELVAESAAQVDDRLPYEGLEWNDIMENCFDKPQKPPHFSSVHFRNMDMSPPLLFPRVNGHGTLDAEGPKIEVHPQWTQETITPTWTTVLVYPEEDNLRFCIAADPALIGDEGADELLDKLSEKVNEVVKALREGKGTKGN